MNPELEKKFPISAEDRVIEECAELIQALLKAKRFGWYSKHPDRKTCNIEDVRAEMSDVRISLDRLERKLIQYEVLEGKVC